MPNAFDQFDTPTARGNPFDQFDGASPDGLSLKAVTGLQEQLPAQSLALGSDVVRAPATPTLDAASEALQGSLVRTGAAAPFIAGGLADALGGSGDADFARFEQMQALADRLGTDAASKSKVGAVAGNVLGIVPKLVAPEVLALDAVSHGTDLSARALQQNKDLATAYGLGGLGTAAGTAGVVMPASVPGNLLVRLLTGGAMNAGLDVGERSAEHAIAPDVVAAPTTEDALTSGGIGAILAAALGHGAAPRLPNETLEADPAPLGLPQGADFAARAERAQPQAPGAGGPVHVDTAGEAATPAQGASAFAQAVQTAQAQPRAPGLGEPVVAVDAQGNAATTADQHAALQPQPPAAPDPLGLTARLRELIAADPRSAREGAPIPPKALPAPAIEVTRKGEARTTAQRNALLEQQRTAAEERAALGITPDIARTQGVRWAKQAQFAESEAERLARIKELDDTIATREAQNKPARGRNAKPDASVDDALTFLAKSGGLDRRTFVKEGLDPATARAPENLTRGGASRPLFRAQGGGGLTLDQAAERLWQHGYLDSQDNNAALDLILHGVNQGEPAYSIHRQPQDDLLALEQARRDAADHVTDSYDDVPFSRKPGDAKFSFAGERARTADRGALQQAQAMEAMGRDSVPDRFGNQPGSPEDTHMATGWHRGVDGKWRFEIDDSQAKLHKDRIAVLDKGGIAPQTFESVAHQRQPDGSYDLDLIPHNPQRVSDIHHLRGIPADALDAILPKDVAARVRQGDGEDDLMGSELGDAKRIRGSFSFGGLNAMPLDLMLDHPALFKAYPELANVTVRVNPDMRGLASYSAKSNMIDVRPLREYQPKGDASLKSVLLHEIQHAIQNHEGFARGGSSAEARTLPEFEQALRQQMAERGGELPDWNEVKPTAPDEIKAAQQVYRRLAGEVEARNTQRRMNMGKDERRAVPPSETADVPRHQQIVRFNADRSNAEDFTDADRQAVERYNAILSKHIGAPVAFTPAAHVPEHTARALAEVGQIFDVRPIVVRNETPDALDINGVTVRDGVMLVNEDATSPALVVTGHELIHQMRRDAPDLYAELVADQRDNLRVHSYGAVLAERAKKSGEQPREMPHDEVQEELVADAAGDALGDPDFIERLAKANPGLFRRFARYALDFLARVSKQLRSLGSSAFLGDVEAFRTKLADVLERYGKRQQGERAGETDPAFQRVFHGTPHAVDKFSLQKIGTGEGAQAYGWGMYFASERAIAEHYREALSPELKRIREATVTKSPVDWAAWMLYDAQSDGAAIDAVKGAPEMFGLSMSGDQLLAQAQRRVEEVKKSGNLYHVEVPEDHDLLDYDKPLSQQPEKVREAMQAILADPRIDATTREEWEHAAPEARTGKRFYNLVTGADGVRGGEKGASELLNEYGIPGLRYLDANSRGKGEGSANYVIWDEGAIGDPEHALSRKPVDDQTQTPAFRKWFGESKVVDAEGKPLRVYHGTPGEAFDVFDHARRGDGPITGNPIAKHGFFFTDDPGVAGTYSGKGGATMPVYLRLENPAHLDMWDPPRELVDDRMRWTDDKVAAWIDRAKRQGHDGVVLHGGDTYREFMVFDRGQIKSATGNAGTFDPENPSILFSRKPSGEETRTEAGLPAASREPRFNRATALWTEQVGKPVFTALGKATKALVANDFLKRHGLNLAEDMPPAAREAWRQYRIDIAKAQQNVAAVGRAAAHFTPAERSLLSDYIEREMAAGVRPPEHVVKTAQMMGAVLTRQSEELVRLGMLSPEAKARWEGRYLPRFYEKHVLAHPWDRNLRAVWRGIKGNHLKGRGLFETVAVKDVPKYQRLGWELRQPSGKSVDLAGLKPTQTVRMWRDFTPAERAKMGEVRDGLYRFARGYTDTQRDIALGRLFERIAGTVARDSDPGGWVQVPDTSVPDTGVKRFGKLAGQWVPGDVLAELQAKAGPQSELAKLYLKALSLWKEGKTSLNPVTHVNNVVSNVVMADLAGLNVADPRTYGAYAAAFKHYKNKSPIWQEAQEAGLFGGEWFGNEIHQYLPIPAELKSAQGQGNGVAAFGRKALDLASKGREAMGRAYQAEDQFFKFLLYLQGRSRGLGPDESVDWAERWVFDYSSAAPGVRKLKNSLIPFANYGAKAIPALAFAATHYPWRVAKWMALLGGLSLYSFLAVYGDDKDEGEATEGALLPDYLRGGSAFFGVPKALRMPWNDEQGHAVYVDISRFLPMGDLFDTENQMGGVPLPAPFMPSNPLLTTAYAMLANKDSFTGQEVTRETDSAGEAAAKRAAWLYRQMAPNNPLVPGTYNFNRLADATAAATGRQLGPYTGTDYNGSTIKPGRALAQTFGVKLRTVDLEREREKQLASLAHEVRDLRGEARQLLRNGTMPADAKERALVKLRAKLAERSDAMAKLRAMPVKEAAE